MISGQVLPLADVHSCLSIVPDTEFAKARLFLKSRAFHMFLPTSYHLQAIYLYSPKITGKSKVWSPREIFSIIWLPA